MPKTQPRPAPVEELPSAVRPGIPMVYWIVVAIMLVAGIWVRLYHITEPPLDMHPQRQYWDANRARLMYYKTLHDVPPEKMAVASRNAETGTEPPIIEGLAVLGYQIAGEENLAIPRSISAIVFVIGGLFLFLLALRFFSPPAALVALAYYLFLPFTMQATRTFQPDPLMTALTVASIFLFYRYYEQPTWRRLIPVLPVVLLALLVKAPCVFFILGTFLALIIGQEVAAGGARRRFWWRALGKPQMLVLELAGFAGLFVYIFSFIAPKAFNTAFDGLHMAVGGQVAKSFEPKDFLESWYWPSLRQMLGFQTLQEWAIIAGAFGLLLCRNKIASWLLLGGWLGGLAYAFFFNYHICTHNYYSLPIVPIIALSLAALVSVVEPYLLPAEAPFRRGIVVVLFAAVLASNIWQAARHQVNPIFTDLVKDCQEIGDIVGHSSTNVFLTYGYGYPLMYHGLLNGNWWPTQADLAYERMQGEAPKSAEERLQELIDKHGKEYFIVTWSPDSGFSEFDQQPDLQKLLMTKYTPIAATERYIVFDLRHPKYR